SQVSGSAVRYLPNKDFNGTDSFTYTVSDSRGGQATASVMVTVTPVNDPPVARNDSVSTTRGKAVTISVLDNDTDPDGDPLTVAITKQPSKGAGSVDSGKIIYAPSSNFTRQDSRTYQITDAEGLSSSAVVTINVTGPNRNPVASHDSVTTKEDTPFHIPVLANDSDPDGDPLTIVSVTQPSNGKITFTVASVRYEPNADFNGLD